MTDLSEFKFTIIYYLFPLILTPYISCLLPHSLFPFNLSIMIYVPHATFLEVAQRITKRVPMFPPCTWRPGPLPHLSQKADQHTGLSARPQATLWQCCGRTLETCQTVMAFAHLPDVFQGAEEAAITSPRVLCPVLPPSTASLTALQVNSPSLPSLTAVSILPSSLKDIMWNSRETADSMQHLNHAVGPPPGPQMGEDGHSHPTTSLQGQSCWLCWLLQRVLFSSLITCLGWIHWIYPILNSLGFLNL